MKKRCSWAEKEVFHDYHDTKWGVPVHDDRILFEFLILEGAQAGLSWETILKRKEGYKMAYDNFDVKKVSRYESVKKGELLKNEGIIRNRLKIHSSVENAKVFINIQKEYGSFDTYLWGFTDGKVIHNKIRTAKDIPVTSPLSDTISKDLKKRGMSFVGSTIIYAYLQAMGVVNDHEEGCFCTSKVNRR